MSSTVNAAATSSSIQAPKLLRPILVGGLVAGGLDLTAAFISFGRGMPLGIASGLLGSQALKGGMGTWILGVVLHFVIAFSAAAIYCLSSLRLKFLRDHFFVCGLFYGIAVFLVMNLIVLPISAVPFKIGPFTVAGLIQGLLVHMLIIGLPISASLRFYSK
jgi:hypothetical protein